MKKLFSLALCLLSLNTVALGGFESLTDTEKKVMKSIATQLGITDTDNSIKMKIYDASSFAFKGKWGSYWTGLTELASSKFKDANEKGVIEIAINNSESGTFFLTYFYKPEVNQIMLFTKQIRHTNKKALLDVFEERKAKKQDYNLKHEGSNYGMLQENGKVNYEFYHVSGGTGSIVYQSQTAIDL